MTNLQKSGLLFALLILCSAAQAQTLNGFDLSEAAVAADQIKRGGVPRDGIPSIDDPKFIVADDADFLTGVVVIDQNRALS